jgi:hypothetical protein
VWVGPGLGLLGGRGFLWTGFSMGDPEIVGDGCLGRLWGVEATSE